MLYLDPKTKGHMWATCGKWWLPLPCPHIIPGDFGVKSWLTFINEPISHVCHFTAAFWISFARIQLMGFYKDVVGQIVGTFLLSVPLVEHCHTNGIEDLQGGGYHSLTPLDTDIQLYGTDTSVKLLLLFFLGYFGGVWALHCICWFPPYVSLSWSLSFSILPCHCSSVFWLPINWSFRTWESFLLPVAAESKLLLWCLFPLTLPDWKIKLVFFNPLIFWTGLLRTWKRFQLQLQTYSRAVLVLSVLLSMRIVLLLGAEDAGTSACLVRKNIRNSKNSFSRLDFCFVKILSSASVPFPREKIWAVFLKCAGKAWQLLQMKYKTFYAA